MSQRDLKFNSVKDVIADVERLKRGHKQNGNWTLPQASWHCGLAIGRCLKEIPPGTQPTPEQLQMQKGRLQPLFALGKMPPGLPIAPGTDPLKDAPQPLTGAEVDKFIAGLKAVDSSPLKEVAFGPFGVIPIADFRKFIAVHSANHLSHFVPAS